MSDDNPQFVDTNILIYAFDASAGMKWEQASALLRNLWENENGRISVQVLQEFYVNVTRKAPNVMKPAEAAGVIRDFAHWPVHRPGVEDVLAAIQLQQRYKISFWDAMIVRSAQESNCEVLWSEDLANEQEYEGVKVVNPFRGQ